MSSVENTVLGKNKAEISPEDGVITYKRRRVLKSEFDCTELPVDLALCKMNPDKEPNCADNHWPREGPDNTDSHCHYGEQTCTNNQWNSWRYILESELKSLSEMGGGGIENCICAALGNAPFAVFGRPQENGYATEASAATEPTLNKCVKAYAGDNTSKCQNTLVEILVSERFVMLCDILFRNFRAKDYRRYIDLTKIHYRMRSGRYEKAPKSFLGDILKLWREFEKVGQDIVRLTNIFYDICRASFQEKIGAEFDFEDSEENPEDTCVFNTETCIMDLPAPNNISNFSIVYNNNMNNNNNSGDSYTTIQQLTLTHSDRSSHPDTTNRTCKICGCNAINSQVLICDGCECAYHINCIRPAVKDIPTQYWYCKSCTGASKRKKAQKQKQKIIVPHEHCGACKLLENMVFTETPVEPEDAKKDSASNVKESDELGPKELCKMCGLKEEDDKMFLKCGHQYCLYKYYHINCLKDSQIAKEEQENRSCWYCPSCLCRGCYADKDDENIVLCDGCDDAYHIYCMKPPRDSVPEGVWYCVGCNLQRARLAMRIYQEELKSKCEKQG
ncbi:Methyl-CpG-binding domain-containing protein 9 [Rhynchospora pubera]|uniref:Methyl-CpG-binding domain-containing protein 9 n=1 Tax=Rhynchospora pubera TaxID=906938 RepID=A0AAV8F498_9POAL|nr:Methyl-CpG-binding domain-containing protein 9 [Rhynchospora pubera]